MNFSKDFFFEERGRGFAFCEGVANLHSSTDTPHRQPTAYFLYHNTQSTCYSLGSVSRIGVVGANTFK